MEPINRNSIKRSSLSNQPFYFLATFLYFSRKRHVVSLPFVICYQSALWNLSCLLFKSVFLACFFNIFHEVEGEAPTSYHTSYNSPRISCFSVFTPVIRYCYSADPRFILYLLCLPSYYLLLKENLLCILHSHYGSILLSCKFCEDFLYIARANFSRKPQMPLRIDNSWP